MSVTFLYSDVYDDNTNRWTKIPSLTLTGATIPANSTINSIILNFKVLAVGTGNSEYYARMTYCKVEEKWGEICEAGSTATSYTTAIADATGADPEVSFTFDNLRYQVSNDISNLIVTTKGSAPYLSDSKRTYITRITAEVNYTPNYTDAPDSVPQNGNINNYPVAGEPSDRPDYGNLTVEGTIDSSRFNYTRPKFYSASSPYYLVYIIPDVSTTNYTRIGMFESSSQNFAPSNSGMKTGIRYSYCMLAYSSTHNGYIRSNFYEVTYNSKPIINSISYEPQYATSFGTNISISISASDSDNDSLTYTITGEGISQTIDASTNILLYPGQYIIKVEDNKGESSTQIITINQAEEFNIIIDENTIINNIDTSVIEEGLVKNIDRLEPIGLLGSTKLNNLSFNVEYYYGQSSDDLTSGNGVLGTAQYFTNIDIGAIKSDIADNGLWYEFRISGNYTYNGISQDKTITYGPFKYPKQISELTTSNYIIYNNNFSGNNDYVSHNIYNDKVYLTLTYPENGTEEYSRINKVNIYAAYSEKETIDMSYLLIDEFNTTSLTSDQFEVNIKDTIPYNNYFKLYVELTTLTGEREYIEIDKSTITPYDKLKRTFLPYFDKDIITSNLPKTIAIKNISDNLILTIPTVHSVNDTTGTDKNSIQILLSKIIFRLSINDSSYDGPILLSNCDLFYYDSSKKSLILSISPSSLLTMIGNAGIDVTENISYNSEIVFQPEDFFGNKIEQTFLINSANERNGEYIIFSLGVKPVLSTSSSNYALKAKIPYSSNVIFDISNSTNEYKNMVNPKDTLYLTFPAATDDNGNDNGITGNHGDIIGYKIKIQESLSNFFDLEEKNFDDYNIITIEDNNLSYNSSTGLYTYSYIMPDRQYTSFAKIAICAYDTTNLESNYYIYEPVIVLGKINYGAAAITNYKKNKTENSSPNYNLTLKIGDIGGNSFINNLYNYSDYPNLERNISGSINDSRDIKFSLYYHTEDNSNFVKYDKELVYNINSGENIYASYDNTIPYSSLINTSINFLNIDFNNTELSLNNKNYFKFVIEVQNGFDTNGEKAYTTIETDTFIIFPITPVMYLGKNAAGINTQELDNDKVLRIATIEQEKSLFQIDSFDEQSSVIFNLVSKIIEGITISDED